MTYISLEINDIDYILWYFHFLATNKPWQFSHFINIQYKRTKGTEFVELEELKQIQEQFPYLSCVCAAEVEYVCIIQNSDEKILSFYDFNSIVDLNEQKLFLELGEIWWFESNRLLPINIFLQGQMEGYKPYLRTVSLKNTEILFGPVTSLNNLFQKRIKRRQIQLVKK